MRHSPFGNAHVSVYRAEFRLIHFVEPDVFTRRERVVVGKVNHRAREPDVPVYLRCTIVLRCCLLARTDKVSKVGFGVEGQESIEGRPRESHDILLKGGKD